MPAAQTSGRYGNHTRRRAAGPSADVSTGRSSTLNSAAKANMPEAGRTDQVDKAAVVVARPPRPCRCSRCPPSRSRYPRRKDGDSGDGPRAPANTRIATAIAAASTITYVSERRWSGSRYPRENAFQHATQTTNTEIVATIRPSRTWRIRALRLMAVGNHNHSNAATAQTGKSINAPSAIDGPGNGSIPCHVSS